MGADGAMKIAKDAKPAVTNIVASADGLSGSARVRIVPDAPYTDDFEDTKLRPHSKCPVNPSRENPRRT